MIRSAFYGWHVVAACFVVAAFAWGLGLFGSSVYLQAVTSAHGWAIAEVSSAITLFFLVSASVQRCVGWSIDTFGPRPILSLGAISLGTGVALIGQATATWHLYPCFVLIGLGWSTLSTTGIAATVAPWFERHQGRSMTLAIMGASVGAIIGVPLLLLTLARLGLAGGLAATGLAAVVVLLPLILIVLRYRGPADLGLNRDGDRADDADVIAGRAANPVLVDRPRILLWSAATGFALALLVQIGFITHHVALAQPVLGVTGAGLLVSGTGAAAFAGRLVLASIVDRVNVRLLAIGVIAVQGVTLAVLAWFPTASVMIVASLIYGYGIGHVTTLGPVVVRREFGAAAFGRTYGAAATAIQFVSAFGPATFGILRDRFGGYDTGLAIAAGITLLASLSLFIGGRSGARTNKVMP